MYLTNGEDFLSAGLRQAIRQPQTRTLLLHRSVFQGAQWEMKWRERTERRLALKDVKELSEIRAANSSSLKYWIFFTYCFVLLILHSVIGIAHWYVLLSALCKISERYGTPFVVVLWILFCIVHPPNTHKDPYTNALTQGSPTAQHHCSWHEVLVLFSHSSTSRAYSYYLKNRHCVFIFTF